MNESTIMNEIALAAASLREADLASRTFSYDELVEKALEHAASKQQAAIIPASLVPVFVPRHLEANVNKWYVRPGGRLMTLVTRFGYQAGQMPEIKHHEVLADGRLEQTVPRSTLDRLLGVNFHFFDNGQVKMDSDVVDHSKGRDVHVISLTKTQALDIGSDPPEWREKVLSVGDYDARRFDRHGRLCIFKTAKGQRREIWHAQYGGECLLMTMPNRTMDDFCPVDDGLFYLRRGLIHWIKRLDTSGWRTHGPVLRLPKGFTGAWQPVAKGCYVEVKLDKERIVEFLPWQTSLEIARPPRLIRDLVRYDVDVENEIASTLNLVSPFLAIAFLVLSGIWAYVHFLVITTVSWTPLWWAIASIMAALACRTASNQLRWRDVVAAKESLAASKTETAYQLSSSESAKALAPAPDLNAAIRSYLLDKPTAAINRLLGADSEAQRFLKTLQGLEVQARANEAKQKSLAATQAGSPLGTTAQRLAEINAATAEQCAAATKRLNAGLGLAKGQYETLVAIIDSGTETIAAARATAELSEQTTATCDAAVRELFLGLHECQSTMDGVLQYVAAWRRGQLDAVDTAAEIKDDSAAFTVRLLAGQAREELSAK